MESFNSNLEQLLNSIGETNEEFKLLVGDCDIINFSWWFGQPRLIVKLES